MKFIVIRTERVVKRNIKGEVVSKRNEYVIVCLRWLRRPRYLHLLPNWLHKLNANEPMGIELTRKMSKATKFNDTTCSQYKVSIAHQIVEAINSNPNNFILE